MDVSVKLSELPWNAQAAPVGASLSSALYTGCTLKNPIGTGCRGWGQALYSHCFVSSAFSQSSLHFWRWWQGSVCVQCFSSAAVE